MPAADTSYLQLPVECGRTEGKGLWVALAFFVLYVIMFRVSGWLIQGSHINKTGSDRVPLPIPCRSLCVPRKFWLVQNVGPLWLPAPGLTHWEVYLLGVMLNSHHHESTRILSSRGNVAAMCKNGVSGNVAVALAPLLTHPQCPYGLYLKNTSSKIILLRISR